MEKRPGGTKKLGLPRSFWDKTYPSASGALLGAKGQRLVEIPFAMVEEGIVACAVKREDLHEALISKINGVKVLFNTTIGSLAQKKGGVEVVLSDKSREKYDLVIAADGVYSKTREEVFGKKPLRPYDWFIWGGYAQRAHEHFAGWYALCGPGEFLLSFPISDTTNTVGLICHRKKFEDPKTISRHQNLHRAFRNLDPQVKGAIDSVLEADPLFFSELHFVKVKEWYAGRVVLAGDSKHARSPVSGMGTTLALEDAYVLAEEIKGNDSIDLALRKYGKRRQARVPAVLRSIDFLEGNVMSSNAFRSRLRDAFLPITSKRFFVYLLKRVLESKL